MRIRTRRFILRDFVDADLPAFEAYQTDSRMLEFYGTDQSSSQHAHKLFGLFRTWADEMPRLNYQLAVIHADTEQLIGSGGIRSIDRSAAVGELGIELSPAVWSRHAYAVELAVSLLDFGFVDLGLKRICGTTVSANRRILRLAKAFGANAFIKESPRWMSDRGWQQIEWRMDCERWMHERLAFARYTRQPTQARSSCD